MANTLKVNPTSLTSGIKKLQLFLYEYEAQYKAMQTNLNALSLDASQMQAIQSSMEAMYTEFQKMKTYLESGVIDVFEMAVSEYKKADAVK